MPQPSRGDVWIVDLGLAAKTRPALVLSVAIEDQDRVLATIVPHTTSLRGTRFEVAIQSKFLKPGAFDGQNLVTIPHAKFVRKLGTLNTEQTSSGGIDSSCVAGALVQSLSALTHDYFFPSSTSRSRNSMGPWQQSQALSSYMAMLQMSHQ